MYFLKTILRKVTKISQQFAANLRASRLKNGTLFFQIVQRQASGLEGGEELQALSLVRLDAARAQQLVEDQPWWRGGEGGHLRRMRARRSVRGRRGGTAALSVRSDWLAGVMEYVCTLDS